MKKNIILAMSALALVACSPEKNLGWEPIKVNQVGYYPNQEKIAVVEDSAAVSKYVLVDATTGEEVWRGAAVRSEVSPLSNKKRSVVDFSEITTPGKYILKSGNYQREVTIAPNALREVGQAGMKAFYLQRTGVEIEEQYAGEYKRPAAHFDTEVLVHPSAATKTRPEGTIISSPGGWYDAGDFNKYIVNSSYTISLMLTAYELNAKAYQGYKNNIPESGNNIPDLLDEMMFNLKWMLTMQDEDGGVYHKLTTPNFEGFIMPTECKQPRYVVKKTTAATLDFAATMAQAARVYKDFPEYEEFCEKATQQAINAFKWAQKNPKITYRQGEINAEYDPDINTGAYDDEWLDDEFFWAASELYFTTGKKTYLYGVSKFRPKDYMLPTWGNVTGLAQMEWMVQSFFGHSQDTEIRADKFQASLINYCDSLINAVPTSCFQSSWGNSASDFCWGCMAEHCCNQGISLLYAYHLTNDTKYLTAALQNADAMLGRNALGYCYVTGFGNKSPMHPHQRLSAADGIEAPLPGFLVGGPNMGRQDRATCDSYSSDCLDESYTDDTNSYASNEIAINWNAALVTFIPWLDYELSK